MGESCERRLCSEFQCAGRRKGSEIISVIGFVWIDGVCYGLGFGFHSAF